MKQILYFLLASLAFLLSACSKGDAPKQALPPAGVHTLVAKGENLSLEYTYPATLTSDYDVVLKAKVSGSIKEQYFKPGASVKKGDKLFLIDPDKYKAAANVAYGSFLVASANHTNMKKDHSRNEILFSKKAISQKEYDTSLANYNSAAANLESTKAQYENAKIDLDYTNVEAPFDGVVGDALVNIGEYVSASATELVRITNLNEIYADFYISDKDKLRLDSNLASKNWEIANIDAVLNINGQKIKGKISFVDSVVNESAKVKAKAVFDNADNKLIPGTFATINMSGFVQKNGYKVPQVAVLQDQKQSSYVYTIKDNKVSKTPVSIAYQNNEFVVIDSGLKNGDKIIVDNFKKIRLGSEVQDLGSR
ncbi:efflux RND transporter periplasmic adaptor subunit [Campylobacter sp. MIT 99-7217]|uniref:efflux RND transporter periplasmic adaptor subunit n=1 Tax=Campylobacter sp. MIT 99-7217 TaxID=535091 RepID=UPI001159E3F7|nr:efflux RND transporter periplasmic adaptor subunit [Campylobacter sp. MIT 99-7217]TQR33844.1 efflux RND transporter periplasmic adaptor subunit [Campylobacter sp. MIT 99-7217]